MQRMDDLSLMEAQEMGSVINKIKRKMKNRHAAYLRVEEGMSMWSESSIMNNKKVGEQK